MTLSATTTSKALNGGVQAGRGPQGAGGVRPLAELTKIFDDKSAIAWLSDPLAVPIIIPYGQSLEAYYISDASQTAITTAPKHPGVVLCPTTAEQNAAAGEIVPARLPQGEDIIGLTDLREFNTSYNGHLISETALSGLLNTFVEMRHDALGIWGQVIGFSAAVGGLTYFQLKCGSDPYNALIKNAKEVAAECVKRGWRPIFLCVPFDQGGSDSNNFTSSASYARYLNQLQRDLDRDLRAISGQIDPVLLYIVQDTNSAFFTPQPVGMLTVETMSIPPIGQLNASKLNPYIIYGGPNFDCAVSPIYHNPHLASRGYLVKGTRAGRGIARSILGGDFRGLAWDETLTQMISSHTIQITFDQPPMRGDGTPTPDFVNGVTVLDTSDSIVKVAGLFDANNAGCGFAVVARQGLESEVNQILYVEPYNPGGNTERNTFRIHLARAQTTPFFLTCAMKQTPLMGVYGAPTFVPGSGGTDGTYDIIFTGGSPSVAPATGTFTVVDGVIDDIEITDNGYGYLTVPNASTANCPGLVGASITCQIVVISSAGPNFGARVLVRMNDATLVTAAGDIVYDWASCQLQGLSGGPAPAPNILRNGWGKTNQRAPLTVSNLGKIHDGWYVNAQSGLITPQTYNDPAAGRMIRLLNNTAGALRFGASQMIASDKTIQLRGQTVTLSGRIRRNYPLALNRTRFFLVSSKAAADPTSPVDLVGNWNSASYVNGGYFLADTNYTILSDTFVDSQNILTDASETVIAVPSDAVNLFLHISSIGGVPAGYALDYRMAFELGASQTDAEDIDDTIELDRARRFYGKDTVGVVAGVKRWQAWPRSLYAAPSVAITGSTGGVTTSLPDANGCYVTGGSVDEVVTRTWDTGL